MKTATIIVIHLCLLAVCSCGSGSKMDAQWQQINRLCDSIPEEAIGMLDTINQENLSERDLSRWRLLWIKSRDKAYVNHTSDTLILDVVDYYDRHRMEGLYPEALYYGGRVYSDLGDLPTALEFFQKSLDEIPDDDFNLRFKGTVLDQTGRLLHTLHLDSAAIEYLERSLYINSKFKDKYHYNAFTHGLIASSLRRLNKPKEARKHMDEAVKSSTNLNESDQQTILSEYADMLYKEDKIDSALLIIRPLPYSVDSITLPFCLGLAAEIYKEAGILDTAYRYARQLIKLSHPSNKKAGYRVIFSDEIRRYVDNDTLLRLIPEYKQVVEDYLNVRQAEEVLIQNTRYNYSVHVKKLQATELQLRSLKETIWFICGGTVSILLAAVSIMFWRKYHKSRRDSQVLEGIILSERLKREPEQLISNLNKETNLNSETIIPTQKSKVLEEIRQERKENPINVVEDSLKASALYMDLKEKADNKKVMGKDVTWRMIEDLIESVSPGFDSRLSILTEGYITPAERNVALLMKCGFSQIQIASLMAKSESTISAQRTSLAKKIGYDKSAISAIIVRL